MRDDVEEGLRALYGEVDWAAAKGVVQVVSIGAARRCVIAMGRGAPASEADRFVLHAARARADAILTTGAILRAEPALRHSIGSDAEERRAFACWRAERLGRAAPPRLIVLSASGEIPTAHPALHEASGGFVWTSAAGAARLGGGVAGLSVVVAEPGNEGLLEAIRAAGRLPGVETLLVEAGPTTCRALHEGEWKAAQDGTSPPPFTRWDELLLSCFEGELAPEAIGPDFASSARIQARFGAPRSEVGRVEDSGAWRFARYRAD